MVDGLAFNSQNIVGGVCFGLAVLHTFSVKQFQRFAHFFPEGSVWKNFFHLIGEVEVVFGFWSGLFLGALALLYSPSHALDYLQQLDFTEPLFVFVILVICSTRPVLSATTAIIDRFSAFLPLPGAIAFYVSALIIGPLMGSLITEPAAMTVTALLLLDRFYKKSPSHSFMYATIGLLFVNVSIGGTLTPYAAPPVLMVASKWDWDLKFMLLNLGWKSLLAMSLSTGVVVLRFRKELREMSASGGERRGSSGIPLWVIATHLVFLAAVVVSSHYVHIFFGVFLFFLGLMKVTQEYHDALKLKEGLMVAFFLGGLVVLGAPQRWWLEPAISHLSSLPLFLGALSLTAITDNAALTYLGSQVPSLSEASRYALVAGSVAGGGLTVIANAPNPAGYGILGPCFGEDGLSPWRLFLSALIPTAIAAACYLCF